MSLGRIIQGLFVISVAGFIILWEDEGLTFGDKHIMIIIILLAFVLYAKKVPYSEIIAYDDLVVIAGFGRRWRYSLPYKDIKTIWAVHDKPFRDYWFIPLLYYLNPHGWRPFSKWRGWYCTSFFWSDDAIAIETSSRKFLVSCVAVDKNAAELRRIANLEEK